MVAKSLSALRPDTLARSLATPDSSIVSSPPGSGPIELVPDGVPPNGQLNDRDINGVSSQHHREPKMSHPIPP